MTAGKFQPCLTMKTQNQTIVSRLLEIVFEGYQITATFHEGRPVFHFYESAAASEISKPRDFAKKHLEKHHLLSIFVDSRSANGVVQKRAVQFLTQSGLLTMVMASRKPAARRLQAFVIDEVLPQLIELGTFIPGATPAEKLQALCRRARQERAELMGRQTEEAAASGLVTLRAFRLAQDIPARDVLAFSREVQHQAKLHGTAPEKRYIAGHPSNPVNVWPRFVLVAAANNTIPKLPFYEETEVAP